MGGKILILASWLVAASYALPAQSQERLAVIVSADREIELSIEEVAQIYLKQRRFWSDRESIVAINREADSDIRKAFTERVFADRARRLNAYWNRQYFKGILPPLTLAGTGSMDSWTIKISMRMLSSLIKADISNILMVSSYFSVLHVIVQLTLVKLDMIQLSFIPEINQ